MNIFIAIMYISELDMNAEPFFDSNSNEFDGTVEAVTWLPHSALHFCVCFISILNNCFNEIALLFGFYESMFCDEWLLIRD